MMSCYCSASLQRTQSIINSVSSTPSPQRKQGKQSTFSCGSTRHSLQPKKAFPRFEIATNRTGSSPFILQSHYRTRTSGIPPSFTHTNWGKSSNQLGSCLARPWNLAICVWERETIEQWRSFEQRLILKSPFGGGSRSHNSRLEW